MANHNTHHMQREIDSLRKQLMKEREESHYDVAVRLRTVTAEVEARILERCIVECMEEANAPIYTEEERIAILTATERLKEMRAERVRVREEQEKEKRMITQKQIQEELYRQMIGAKAQVWDQNIAQGVLRGAQVTQTWWDDKTTGGLV